MSQSHQPLAPSPLLLSELIVQNGSEILMKPNIISTQNGSEDDTLLRGCAQKPVNPAAARQRSLIPLSITSSLEIVTVVPNKADEVLAYHMILCSNTPQQTAYSKDMACWKHHTILRAVWEGQRCDCRLIRLLQLDPEKYVSTQNS